MKKYRLIKKYPGSPELGEIRTGSKENCRYYPTEKCMENNPEFWEEVVEYPIGTKVYNSQTNTTYTKKEDGWYKPAEKTAYTDEMISSKKHLNILNKSKKVIEKDYEILSFYHNNKLFSKLHHRSSKTFPYWSNEGTWVSYDKFCKIHSVKRLSDGEVFTIGDKVKFQGNGFSDVTTIFKFEFVNGKIHAHSGSASFHINFIHHIKKPFDKDYEILTYQSKDKIIAPATNFAIEISKPGHWNIYSVKRLSDGEVFTVGDKVVFLAERPYLNTTTDINKFRLESDGTITVCNSGCLVSSLKNIKSINNPLFTTEDGVDIYKGDKVWYINLHTYNISKNHETVTSKKYFSTKEAAEEYILMNTPCLSANDVIQYCIDNYKTVNDHRAYKLLKELVKSKL